MNYNSELAQDMINYLSQLTSQRDYEVGQLANMLVKEFANEKGMTYTVGKDPISQYPEETEDAFDGVGMYRVFLDWRKQTLGEGKTMKITKRQLRRIIKEEKAKLLEAGPYRPPKGIPRDADLDELDALAQAMFAAYNNIAALLDDAEEFLSEPMVIELEQALDTLERASEKVSTVSR